MINKTGETRKELVWVPGHTGIMGNDMADYRAKLGVHMGSIGGLRSKVTPAGIKQLFRLTDKRKQVSELDRNAPKWYTYIYTDKGPFMYWLHKIGRKDSSVCPCGEGIIQNVAHIRRCKGVEDGRRTMEQIEDDPEVCAQVHKFLQAQV